MAADALSIIPGAVLRNLSDKIYEQRKNAALEIEGIVKQLATAGQHEKISAVMSLLTNDFMYSPEANHRKGGLIGLAAVSVGLSREAAQHLEIWSPTFSDFFYGILLTVEMDIGDLEERSMREIAGFYRIFFINMKIVPPVLNSFRDQDSRVRYYACEALYNIAKVVKGDFIIYFNQIFDALCKLSADSDPNVQSAALLLDRLVKDILTESDQFSIEEFIPLLRERMNVSNPYVKQYLVGWITMFGIDMLGFLPDFLDGLFNMLSDSNYEIRQQAAAVLSEFLQEIKNSPNIDFGRVAEILVRRSGSDDAFTRLMSTTWMSELVKLGGEHNRIDHYIDEIRSLELDSSPKVMPLELLRKITNDFSKKQRLGSGTFGTVYKGILNGKEVAVKLLHSMSGRDYEEEFMQEFKNLRRLNHPNIVQLFGYCYEIKRVCVEYEGRFVLADKFYRLLCFDYMHNGSLQQHLHDESHGLDWQTRYKIIKGTCEGLYYLHKGLETPMLHLDLKPGNILLDKNMVPKLADFGLSKLVCDNQTRATSSFLGTIRYCPPEHIERHIFSSKFDIFSLGVVMIEIIAGPEGYCKALEMSSQEFIDHVQENWRKRIHQATPGCTLQNYECRQVKRCIEIALECVRPERMQRPDIEAIISRLNVTENNTEKSATTCSSQNET